MQYELNAAGYGTLSRIAAGPAEWSLILLMGVITAVPLLGFATAARLLPLSVVGILQFIAPSLQFVVGAVLYGEPVSSARLFSFVLIWVGLAIFTVDAWKFSRQARPQDGRKCNTS